jgi:anaphase-promoting complex subunit 8
VEQALEWNVPQVRVDLQQACRVLSDRGLKLAAKWAAEQWMGLPPFTKTKTLGESTVNNVREPVLAPSVVVEELGDVEATNPHVYYAKSLMDLGEYAHAAAVLSAPIPKHASIESMPPPLAGLSPAAFYLRAYALYMAGERRKEEEYLELKNEAQKHVPARNPYLQQLSFELLDAYEDDRLDAFGLYVYGMILVACETHNTVPPHSPPAFQVLVRSVCQFPWNWSAWLDLATCVVQNRSLERIVEDGLEDLHGHCVYHLFCAHIHVEHQDHEEALVLYERWMEPKLLPASPYVLTQYAIAQYHLRQFTPSQTVWENLHQTMPYRIDSMDVYSNILYVQEDAVGLSQLAHTTVQVDKYRAETCCIVGNYYSLKQQRAKAIQYFQRALKIDRTFTSAWTLMGHEYVEWKQTANAMEAYRRAVQVAPEDYRAWYGLGQTYEILNMHLYALYYYKKAAHLRPYDARMWCAVGTTLVQLNMVADAIRAYEKALSHDDKEGVATQKLAALYQQEGQQENAAQCYMRHLELRHQVTYPNAGALGSSSLTLETMLQGLVLESPEAEAVLFLANYHKSHGELDTAGTLASRLLEYSGPEKEQAKALLRELRSRKATVERRGMQTRSQDTAPDDSFAFSP